MKVGRFAPVVLVLAVTGCQPEDPSRNPQPAGDGKPWTASGDAVRGADLFKKNQCENCHPGGANNLEPDKPVLVPNFFERFPTKAALVKRIREGGTAMPPFEEDRISAADLEDLIAYIVHMNKTGSTEVTVDSDPRPVPSGAQ